jgi:hypothetical protein
MRLPMKGESGASHQRLLARWFVKYGFFNISQSLHSHKAWKQATPDHRSMRGYGKNGSSANFTTLSVR